MAFSGQFSEHSGCEVRLPWHSLGNSSELGFAQPVHSLGNSSKLGFAHSCPGWDSNPHWTVFETASSTGWDTGARGKG